MCVLCATNKDDKPLACAACGAVVCLDIGKDGLTAKRGLMTKAGYIFCYECSRTWQNDPGDNDFLQNEESTDVIVSAD